MSNVTCGCHIMMTMVSSLTVDVTDS